MRRFIMLVTVVLLMTAMLVAGAAPAMAQPQHFQCGANAVGHLVDTPKPGEDLRGKCILR
jgi:hypothetical protein